MKLFYLDILSILDISHSTHDFHQYIQLITAQDMYGLIKMQNPGLPAEENLSETVFGEMDKNKVMTLLHMA